MGYIPKPTSSFDAFLQASAAPGRTGGSVPENVLKKTCWKYTDFLRLYRNLSDADYQDMYTTFEGASGSVAQQCALDLEDEIRSEARRRGLRQKDIVAEFETLALRARMPSMTGISPAMVRPRTEVV